MSAPADSPARNTRRQTRIEQRKQQLRATYPLQRLVPHPSHPRMPSSHPLFRTAESDIALRTQEYEKALRDAAEEDTEWPSLALAYLANASVGGNPHEYSEYLRNHYLPHLHCHSMTFMCTDCSREEADINGPREEPYDDSHVVADESVFELYWRFRDRDMQTNDCEGICNSFLSSTRCTRSGASFSD